MNVQLRLITLVLVLLSVLGCGRPEIKTVIKIDTVLCPEDPIARICDKSDLDDWELLTQLELQREELIGQVACLDRNLRLWESTHQLCQDKLNRGTPAALAAMLITVNMILP